MITTTTASARNTPTACETNNMPICNGVSVTMKRPILMKLASANTTTSTNMPMPSGPSRVEASSRMAEASVTQLDATR